MRSCFNFMTFLQALVDQYKAQKCSSFWQSANLTKEVEKVWWKLSSFVSLECFACFCPGCFPTNPIQVCRWQLSTCALVGKAVLQLFVCLHFSALFASRCLGLVSRFESCCQILGTTVPARAFCAVWQSTPSHFKENRLHILVNPLF